MCHSRVPWGLLAPNPSASIPSGKGLTPNGDGSKCETSIDYEQPVHGYVTGVVIARHLPGVEADEGRQPADMSPGSRLVL